MKKITVAILAIVYLGVTSGFAMTIHYCMGKVASVDMMHTSDKCGKCGMKTNTGCCKDEFKIVKLEDSHKLISNDIKIYSPTAVTDNAQNIFDTRLFSSRGKSDNKNHSPPESPGVSLNILHGVFRI